MYARSLNPSRCNNLSYPFRTLAVLHLIFTLHAVYYYLIVNFGKMAALKSLVWCVYLASD